MTVLKHVVKTRDITNDSPKTCCKVCHKTKCRTL